jgi:hypothetical protein
MTSVLVEKMEKATDAGMIEGGPAAAAAAAGMTNAVWSVRRARRATEGASSARPLRTEKTRPRVRATPRTICSGGR